MILTDLFEKQVRETPHELALIQRERQFTYEQLNEEANRLAHYLIERNIGPEDVVALVMPRGIDIIISILGVLKAGAAYLPLDPTHPKERLRFMFNEAGPVCVITTSATASALPDAIAPVLYDHPAITHTLYTYSADNPIIAERKCALLPAHPAYVIYTSGTTGRPKGVVITHAAISNLALALPEHTLATAGSRIAQYFNFTSDPSIWELVMALTTGATLIILEDEQRTGRALRDALVEYQVSHVTLPTLVLRGLENDDLTVKTLLVGGEACLPELAARYAGGRRMLNAYGPTETTVCATISSPLKHFETPPIGKPLANIRTYVLDDNLEFVREEAPGHLYVAGTALARGYLKEPALTAERFIPDPHGSPGERMYDTGDFVRSTMEEDLVFLGRADQQVKIRGFRVELEEIEAVLRRLDGVRDAVAAVHGEAESRHLVGYVMREQLTVERPDDSWNSRLEQWQKIYRAVYQEDSAGAGDFNLTGWNDSYTGKGIAESDMRIWVEETVRQLRELKHRHVLEIGCGTGLLLTRLAADCESYVGLDFSKDVLEHLRAYLSTRADLGHVELLNRPAHDLSSVRDDSQDLVILNSVVQYFPDVQYLVHVLEQSVRVTRPGGSIFVGDVRNLELLEAFHTSVQLFRAAPGTALSDLRGRTRRAQQSEEELLVRPRLFEDLAATVEKIGRIETRPKPGLYNNELSRFRYDVIIRIGPKTALASSGRCVNWDCERNWREAVRESLACGDGEAVRLRGVPDLRVMSSVEAVRLLSGAPDQFATAEALRAASAERKGENLSEVLRFAQCLNIEVCWGGFGADGIYDVIFNPHWHEIDYPPQRPLLNLNSYANTPAKPIEEKKFISQIKEQLREQLPDYMVPSTVMILDRFPSTANGKLDRNSLPKPASDSAQRNSPKPRTPIEQALADIWTEVLDIDSAGLNDSFLELGGNSLIAAQVISRVRQLLDVDLPLQALFDRSPTLERVSSVIQDLKSFEPRAVSPIKLLPRRNVAIANKR